MSTPQRSASLAEALLGAAQLIAAVLGGRNFDVALAVSPLAGVTRAAAMDIGYTALRAYGRGDFLLGLLLGAWLGHRLHVRISDRLFRILVCVLLVLLGAMLLIRH